MWKPIECIQTHSCCYNGTTKLAEIKGILVHSTGANNPNLKRYVQPYETDDNYNEMIALLGKNTSKNDYNHKANWEQGMNAVIGKLADGTVATVQTLPWNYRPWGCGKGTNGSCNDGFLQAETCEDGLEDPVYFSQIFEETAQWCAYLCNMFNLNPTGTVSFKGVDVPVITCHCEAHKLGLASNHRDVMHWYKKHNKTLDDLRNRVQEIIDTDYKKPVVVEKKEIYRIRKSWADYNSQVGAFSNLDNAIAKCKTLTGYRVFDSSGTIVYPEQMKIGDRVQITGDNPTYEDGKAIPKWLLKKKLYVRQIKSNDYVVISTVKIGPITGSIHPDYLQVIKT